MLESMPGLVPLGLICLWEKLTHKILSQPNGRDDPGKGLDCTTEGFPARLIGFVAIWEPGVVLSSDVPLGE